MEESRESGVRWEGRPWVAALVRAFVLVAPIVASVLFVHVASQLVSPPSGSTLLYVAWWVGLSALATLVLIGIDRLTRRLLPLAALLKLALVFPDEAPSRFRAALSAGNTADLEQRLADARQGVEGETPVEAAERLLGFVGRPECARSCDSWAFGAGARVFAADREGAPAGTVTRSTG